MSSTASVAANDLPRIRVRRQWDQVTAEARSRWDTLRLQLQARRRRRDAD
jgi:hypothetical protein